MYKRFLVAAFFFLTFCTCLATASTPQPPSMPHDYVVDLAGVIPEEVQAQLNAYLKELEQKTTAQVLVLTVQSLDGQSIEEFAFNTKELWKLGQKGKDNGLLIAVAVHDRKYRIETGYGLEGVLPDSLVGSIGREYLVPSFRKGDYGTGIYAAVVVVANIIATHDGVHITGMPIYSQTREIAAKPLGTLQMVIFGIFALGAMILFITHPGQCLLLMLASSMGGGRGWSGGDGGFGGGGSFGGGGGGSGGGGGASGGW